MAVSTDDDRIANDVAMEAHLAAHDVLKNDFGLAVALVRPAKANGGLLSRVDPCLRLLHRQRPASTRVERRSPLGHCGLAIMVELLGRTEAVVRRSARQQLLRV